MGNILQLSKFNFKVGGYSDVPSAGGCALPAFREGRQAIETLSLFVNFPKVSQWGVLASQTRGAVWGLALLPSSFPSAVPRAATTLKLFCAQYLYFCHLIN